jgi:hypothetical protein
MMLHYTCLQAIQIQFWPLDPNVRKWNLALP